MKRYTEFYNAIDEIKDFLFRDLVGPVEENEVIESVEPLNYYAMGILWAKRLGDGVDNLPQINMFDEYDEEIEDYIHTEDDSITSANKYKPSAMGISVMLPASTKNLCAKFSFGKYTMSSIKKPSDVEGKKSITTNYFTRKTYDLTPTFDVPERLGTINSKEHRDYHNIGVDITLCVRKIMNDGSKLVTISAANAVVAAQQAREQNENALFQCSLRLYCIDGFLPVYQNILHGNNKKNKSAQCNTEKFSITRMVTAVQYLILKPNI